jgi:hypothetical protein
MAINVRVDFKGICTHLTKWHRVAGAPKFDFLRSDLDTSEVEIQHRVFLANSALINSRIDPDRCVVPHVPKLRIFSPSTTTVPYELILDNVVITFENLSPSEDPGNGYSKLSDLPHMWELTKGPGVVLRHSVLETTGWTHYASAYVDFPSGMVDFSVDTSKNSSAKLTFGDNPDKPPTLVIRPCNSAKNAMKTELAAGTLIEISNLPSSAVCSPSDYLLNFFATPLDISQSAPIWDPPTNPWPGNEVYCTSTGYP